MIAKLTFEEPLGGIVVEVVVDTTRMPMGKRNEAPADVVWGCVNPVGDQNVQIASRSHELALLSRPFRGVLL